MKNEYRKWIGQQITVFQGVSRLNIALHAFVDLVEKCEDLIRRYRADLFFTELVVKMVEDELV